MRLQLDRIVRAREAIDPVFLDAPQEACAPLGAALGCALTLQIETRNPVGSFKGRGTEAMMARLAEEGAARAVCASAGNLGLALAWSGRRRGIPVTVVAAERASPVKIERIRELGADVRLTGRDIEDARAVARELAAREGLRLVEDSLDLPTCEGAGTIGLELCDAPGRFDAVLVALGGGALASGVGCVAKVLAPQTEVIAVQPEQAPAMARSWRRGSVVTTETCDTIADGVAGRFPIPEVLDDLLTVVDDVALVREASIMEAMGLLQRDAGLMVEPSAALGVAAILEDRERFAGRRVATVICGANVLPEDVARWAISPGARPGSAP